MLLVGPPVEALREWLERADIGRGRSFQAIDRREAVEGRALMLQSASWIVKQGCAGREAEGVSALGLRDRYLTGAAREGIGLPEAMQQPQHRSVQQATGYYTEAERAQGRGGSLV